VFVAVKGRCTLLLGPPGSGKTTFLKVLGNRLRGCNRLKVGSAVVLVLNSSPACFFVLSLAVDDSTLVASMLQAHIDMTWLLASEWC
jgi:ABC-type hemin transport system ATPase subunit